MQDTNDIDIHAVLASRKQIAAVWSAEDVLHVRPDLNPEQAWQVLLEVKDNHDTELGINWDTLRITAAELFPRTKAYDVRIRLLGSFCCTVEAAKAEDAIDAAWDRFASDAIPGLPDGVEIKSDGDAGLDVEEAKP